MLDLILGPITWIADNVGAEAALGFAAILAILFAVIVVLQARRSAAVRAWYEVQFDEFKRETESAKAAKGSAEGDAERWATLNDALRRRVGELERECIDLRAGVVVPQGAHEAMVVQFPGGDLEPLEE